MAEYTRELFLQALAEWGRYEDVFRSLPAEEQAAFLKKEGYASLRDLLAHVGAWWEEARGIIEETIQHGVRPSRKYDFAEFNAAAVKRFKDTPEAEFMAWYEAERQRILALVSGLTDPQLHIPRISGWLDGVVLEHLKEHGIDAPRFLVIDTLQREWGDYPGRFAALSPDEQAAFLAKQGFERFRDLMGHIIAWWEQGITVIEDSSAQDPCDVEDVDAFNAEAVRRFSQVGEGQVLTEYQDTRLTLANLVDMLPEEILSRRNVNEWLRADVINHYYEHAL